MENPRDQKTHEPGQSHEDGAREREDGAPSRELVGFAVVAGGAFVATVCAVAVGAFLFASRDDLDSWDDLGGHLAGTVESSEKDSYTPTSAYVEEGADSNVTQFGFGSGGSSSGKDAPGQVQRLSDSTVDNIMKRHQNELIQCYAKGLQERDMKGKVDFAFAVAPDGHVAMVKVTRSGLRSKKVEDCFVQKAKDWKFPKSGGGQLTKFDTDFTFTY
jgi:hypothetical protein